MPFRSPGPRPRGQHGDQSIWVRSSPLSVPSPYRSEASPNAGSGSMPTTSVRPSHHASSSAVGAHVAVIGQQTPTSPHKSVIHQLKPSVSPIKRSQTQCDVQPGEESLLSVKAPGQGRARRGPARSAACAAGGRASAAAVLRQSSRPRPAAGSDGTRRVPDSQVSPAGSVPGCPPVATWPFGPQVRLRRPPHQHHVPRVVLTRADALSAGRSARPHVTRSSAGVTGAHLAAAGAAESADREPLCPGFVLR